MSTKRSRSDALNFFTKENEGNKMVKCSNYAKRVFYSENSSNLMQHVNYYAYDKTYTVQI